MLRCIFIWLIFCQVGYAAQPAYVGNTRCIACHEAQGKLWQESHHAKSMQVASPKTVLGDFNNTEFYNHGQRTRFFRKAGKYFVRTQGADGKEKNFQVAYSFGVYPLQQYLLALPGGRLQALGVAWDARARASGGQRWYHLYPDSPPLPGEAAHWSGRDQNWNFMCASCHSTGVLKNYDLTNDRYSTTWEVLNVGCEACHGPGSAHVLWANGHGQLPPLMMKAAMPVSLSPSLSRKRARESKSLREFHVNGHGQLPPLMMKAAMPVSLSPSLSRKRARESKSLREFHVKGDRQEKPAGLGLVVKALPASTFNFSEAGQKIARTQNTDTGQLANEICLGCHSRRQELVADQAQGTPYLDHYQPGLIEAGLYHADGQIDGEVFEAGSYAQSAMHRAGVACNNCHEPHGSKLRAAGNALCAQCHLSSHYDNVEHHHHNTSSTGAVCVNCHMPTQTYMGVHQRRDHSLRIPRPDQQPGTPNACNQCHQSQTAAWAAAAINQWTGSSKPQGFGQALGDAWQGHPSNGHNVSTENGTQAARSPLPNPLPQAGEGANEREFQIDKALLQALQSSKSGMVKASLLLALKDPPFAVLSAAAQDRDGLVRLGVARALSAALSAETLKIGIDLLDDPLLSVRVEAARALAGVEPAMLTAPQQRRLQQTTAELIKAELACADRPEAHVNLAAIYMSLKQADNAEAALRTALRLAPDFVPALVNLADLYRLQHKDADAEPLLRRAVIKAPEAAEPAHALGLLLVRKGEKSAALSWLHKAVQLAPNDTDYAKVLDIAQKDFGAASEVHYNSK